MGARLETADMKECKEPKFFSSALVKIEIEILCVCL